MKTLLAIVCLFLGTSVQAQKITSQFLNWRNDDVKKFVIDSEDQFLFYVNRLGFTAADTICMYYNLKKEYTLVTHNITDSSKLNILYRQAALHMDHLQRLRYLRLGYFRLLVRHSKNKYYKTNFNMLALVNRPTSMKDKKMIQDLSDAGITDKYLGH